MIYGGVQMEHIQLNEETLWTGGPHSYDNPNAYGRLSELKRFIKYQYM